MKTPQNQAKLLLFCLLQNVKSNAWSASSAPGELSLTLRTAKRSDIPSITRVNLECLPENYHQSFYLNHLYQWPELALVIENNSSSSSQSTNNNKVKWPFSGHQTESDIVGYVLGKVDEDSRAGRLMPVSATPSDRVSSALGLGKQNDPAKLTGHVTSLAVSKDYRRLGLAGELMNQLHHQMKKYYMHDNRGGGVKNSDGEQLLDCVSLHVRMSNKAATRLYCDTLGYTVADIIKGYYQDGEDAFLMKKKLCDVLTKEQEDLIVFDTKKRDEPNSSSITNLEEDHSMLFLPRKLSFMNQIAVQ